MATKLDTTKRTRLDRLRISKIALVGEGADPEARVVIAKAADEAKPKTFAQINGVSEALNKWDRARWAFEDSVRSILCVAEPKERAALLKQTLEEFSAFAAALVPELAGTVAKAAEIVAPGYDAGVLELLGIIETFSKSADAAITGDTDMTFDRNAVKDPAVLAEIDRLDKLAKDATARAEAAERIAKAAQAASAPDADSPEAIAKAIEAAPAELRPVLSSMQSRLAKQAAKIEADAVAAKAKEEEIAKEREKIRKDAAVAKAKTFAGVAGADEAALVEVFLQAPEAVAATIEGVLKGAQAIAKTSGMFKEAGSPGASAGAVDANAKLESLAKEKAKAEGIAYPAAYLAVVRDPANAEIAKQALAVAAAN